ncbi:hypothetical protein WJX73_001007 [Symbiochloris irregularis]|uniref:DDT domain-containing protein n=1 Tax=Symbiochloris irregularis TaxID=706552 RepID=A0AAW1PW94_9CHLO
MASVVEEKARKPRTTNPGVRVQGGRIYDSETGTTCHQCRQKTVEVKGKCSKCTLYWCPRCLLNRYGEEVSQVTAQQEWPCPRCRGLCNCSNCRKKQGMEATGILSHVCKAAGLASVSVLLEKNPTAKRPSSATLPNPQAAKAPKKRKATPPMEAPGNQFLRSESDTMNTSADEAAPADKPRPPLPAKQILTLPAEVRAAPTSGRTRQRGKSQNPGAKAEAAASQRQPLPAGCSAGDLIEVLEFLQTFAGALDLKLPEDMGPFTSELLQSASSRRELRGENSSSVAHVHASLLKKMREAAGLRSPAPFWQEGMREYLVSHQQHHREQQQQQQQDAEAPSPDDRDVQLQDAYDKQGYWSLPPPLRLSMLCTLCHDLLQTHLLREVVDRAVEEQEKGQKEQRSEAAAARKEARAKMQRARDREIAAILSGCTQKAMTLEEQRQDREGSMYWQLMTARHLSGQAGALLVSRACSLDHRPADTWHMLQEPNALMVALDPIVKEEAALLAALSSPCGTSI